LYDKAVIYKLKQGDLITKSLPVDSNALIWVQYELQMYHSDANNQLNYKSVKSIIDYAIRNRNNKLKTYEFGTYRKYLINRDRMDLLYRLYSIEYPAELKQLELKDPSMYLRLMAFFKEEEHNTDSADYYFRKAEVLMKHHPVAMMVSNFYNRYGQFLRRHGRNREAIEKFTLAFKTAQEDKYFGKFDFMLSPSRELESLYKSLGDYEHAYMYSAINRELADSINILTKKEQVIMLDISREATQKEHAAELIINQRKMERNMLAGGVASLLILSLLIYRNYKNQKRLNRLLDIAKKKSDELLLNILPHETAEELKVSGSARAKRFEEVTVMFTDFKDFTQHSEKMNAEDLVKVIHFYYSEFDRIISNHGIEKIKIIGDSYMCAGGLPVSNNTHAHDVVSAALELQAFMIRQKIERRVTGDTFFELRIGIHTGPVVAGIVGTRKFAYDIWGDTVNTASRMENTCETDKVNISGKTFERVKDYFKCTYRGKVGAKHKGEIDMYFVEPFS
jgi:class 3 adenylate cyclase